MTKQSKTPSKLVPLGTARAQTKGINGKQDEAVLGGRFN